MRLWPAFANRLQLSDADCESLFEAFMTEDKGLMREDQMKECLTAIVTVYQIKLSTSEDVVEDVTGLDAKGRDTLHTTLQELNIDEIVVQWLDENAIDGKRSIELPQFWSVLNAWYDAINKNVQIQPGARKHGGGNTLCTGSEEPPQSTRKLEPLPTTTP